MEVVSEKKNSELKKLNREEKHREVKIEEQLMKSLAGVPTIEEKFNMAVKKYIEVEKDNRRINNSSKQRERSLELAIKEKENLQAEYNKAVLTRSKLESLCRELQRQNKTIKDESLSKIREEDEKRKETQAKFQKSLNEIQTIMNENNDKNMKLKDENTEMANKFKFILEQYELRDQQMEKMNKQIDLVTQLNEAKLAKAQMEATAEKEALLGEKAVLNCELLKVKKQLAELQGSEKFLQDQVNLYSDKYGEFQNSLKKSHDIFAGYKTDMDKMTKKIQKLERESGIWKAKFERSNSIVIDLSSEKQVRDEHITKTTRQMYHLQKLCRTLQGERTAFFNALKDNQIDIPVVPINTTPIDLEKLLPPPKPSLEKIKRDKLDMMSKNCAALKQDLAQLQGQLYSINNKTNNDPAKIEETCKTNSTETKKIKNKNKKSKKEIAATINKSAVVEENGFAENKDEKEIGEISTEIDTVLIPSANGIVEVNEECVTAQNGDTPQSEEKLILVDNLINKTENLSLNQPLDDTEILVQEINSISIENVPGPSITPNE